MGNVPCSVLATDSLEVKALVIQALVMIEYRKRYSQLTAWINIMAWRVKQNWLRVSVHLAVCSVHLVHVITCRR